MSKNEPASSALQDAADDPARIETVPETPETPDAGRELAELDAALREHGSSVADVIRKAAQNQYGIAL
jgi:hypothetical protein